MKIFQRYNPLQVAKYVKILFRGRLYIKDVGAFEFDKGKILIPKVKDKLHLSVMSEVNRQVFRIAFAIFARWDAVMFTKQAGEIDRIAVAHR